LIQVAADARRWPIFRQSPEAAMSMPELLQQLVVRNASDLLLSVGSPPTVRVDGSMIRLRDNAIQPRELRELAESVLDERQKPVFATHHDMNFTLDRPNLGRFRISLYHQRGEPAMAVRYIPHEVPSLDELHLPRALKELVLLPRGLVLVVGASGSGKSTTLAAMIDYRNRSVASHILTVEDPIEYVHVHRKSIVDQREVGIDTDSFAGAMENAMRQSADVILIGEIRDRSTMEQALLYAETGQLCLATLHATNSSQALDRIVNFFPDSARAQILMDLSLNLKAVISQRLLRSSDGGRRVPAVELLLQTSLVSDLILKGQIHQLREAMKQGADSGMSTFEESLWRLYSGGKISMQEALANADSRSDFSLRARLSEPLALADGESGTLAMQNPEPAESEAPDRGWVDDRERSHRA